MKITVGGSDHEVTLDFTGEGVSYSDALTAVAAVFTATNPVGKTSRGSAGFQAERTGQPRAEDRAGNRVVGLEVLG